MQQAEPRLFSEPRRGEIKFVQCLRACPANVSADTLYYADLRNRASTDICIVTQRDLLLRLFRVRLPPEISLARISGDVANNRDLSSGSPMEGTS